jgi:DNA-binding PucR family transcriptional regulator
LRGLLALSMLMTERGDEHEIFALLATAVPSIARCELLGVYDSESGWRPIRHETALAVPDLAREIAALDSTGGRLVAESGSWLYALPLRSLDGVFGYALVGAEHEPVATDQYLLRLLAQQTGIAVANARLHERERSAAGELRAANTALADTLADLERSTAIHQRLTEIAVGGGDQQTIAAAVHFLTEYPVVIEDRYGNVRAAAGLQPDEPAPKSSPRARSAMLRRAIDAAKPIRDGDHLLVVAHPQADLLGVIALIDPAGTAGEREQTALEHGATVLSMELARLRAVAETELRLGRDLVDDLLGGADEERSLARAQGLGYDLERSHRVVVVEVDHDREPDDLFHTVRRAARDLAVGSLLAARGATVAVLSDLAEPGWDWERFRSAVDEELGRERCRVGVGSACTRPADFPRSHREAELALKVQRATAAAEQVTQFDDLGVFRILAESEELSGIDRFVDRWLGALLDYDKLHGAALVDTLSRYLEMGGNYDATAQALSTHRNTVKYRLQRIRAVSGFDLADPDTRFNLQLASRALQTLTALEA